MGFFGNVVSAAITGAVVATEVAAPSTAPEVQEAQAGHYEQARNEARTDGYADSVRMTISESRQAANIRPK